MAPHSPPPTPQSAYPSLSPTSRKRLVDGLASGLSVVAASAPALTTSPPPDAGERAAQATLHRSALKAYVFFLAWVQAQADDEASAAVAAGGGAAAAPPPARGRGRRGGGAAAAPAAAWTWDAGRERAARAWAALASTDLRLLFAPAPVADGLLARWVASAVALLAAPVGARDRAVRDAATAALASAASSHGQSEAVAAAAVDALRRAEHLPGPLADVAAAAADAAGDDRLAVELLRAVATADPTSYEGVADAAAARSAGAFLVELADRLPRSVCGHVALLLPVLGGKTHALRSGVVGAMAVLVHRACGDPRSDGGDAEPPASHAARLRTKAHLLDVLTERARDASAFTRARVLAALAYLADKGALPLGHWDAVTRVAIGRLDDKAALVRRGALALLASLMLYNPFGPALPRARFDASLAEYEERLAAADARARAPRAPSGKVMTPLPPTLPLAPSKSSPAPRQTQPTSVPPKPRPTRPPWRRTLMQQRPQRLRLPRASTRTSTSCARWSPPWRPPPPLRGR